MELYEKMVRRDIVEKTSEGDDAESDEDNNKNLAEALDEQALEDALNQMAIAELSD